ncbi:MAG: glutamate--tRNA ligase [Niastella sp. SCN 39-18]|nr:glutamate--tRNA ligase [Sphingobacteriales bacterium]ODT54089.1 MAG: glutamate--tRNA ligase [Niastella sp. SCN 39-18]OJW09752.1 MAG: glutamate--tRNA ligase [Sphingobacteriales bacterium 39-19]
MKDRKIRVRFAPSPTGGLHLGGVRTVLYNYLFARQQQGTFIVRIEDTDQSRYVPGAEDYIFKCLAWCGLLPDESPLHPGDYGPYRQSERKPLYLTYAEQLIASKNAYYAFDTAEELEQMRNNFKTEENPSPQYDRHTRMKMKNSLVLSEAETQRLIQLNTPYVIRIKMPENETISFTDMVHGEVTFNSSLVDDKVLLKADGMPTYHLAVVVDDFLMKITHAFRGEEWLSSAPVHILLWKYLFGLEWMPQWAHLPLILGPHGKLSKRDGAKYGFPVFAMNWTDPKTHELTEGFYEKGFLPEAFINLLAVLGWNDGTEQELFNMNELIAKFSLDRVHTSGAKFDFEKAKWFNQEWIKKLPASQLRAPVKQIFEKKGIHIKDDPAFDSIVELVKDRCTLLPDFYTQASYFFKTPEHWDEAAVKPKWTVEKNRFFYELIEKMNELPHWELHEIENIFKLLAAEKNIKAGELLLPFRVMLVGGKFGPAVFLIAEKIGKPETINRVSTALNIFNA